jgi:hypothetical protein
LFLIIEVLRVALDNVLVSLVIVLVQFVVVVFNDFLLRLLREHLVVLI